MTWHFGDIVTAEFDSAVGLVDVYTMILSENHDERWLRKPVFNALCLDDPSGQWPVGTIVTSSFGANNVRLVQQADDPLPSARA